MIAIAILSLLQAGNASSVASTASTTPPATSASPAPSAQSAPSASSASSASSTSATQTTALELVESAPVETTLDHADLRNVDVVWREMIDGAAQTLDFAEFYASDVPGSKLGPVVDAVERAAARGVRVRFLAEKKFQVTYPETLARLARSKGIEVRLYDMKALTGGVLHAKYFLVDGSSTYFGSQNFDWRSIEHIQELGMRVVSREATAAWQGAFDLDWALAGGAKREDALKTVHVEGLPIPIGAARHDVGGATPGSTPLDSAVRERITPVYSPRDLAPDPALWDLPRIVSLIDGAKRSVRVQLLTYKMGGRNGEYFDELESALRRAALRGVSVQLLVADWCMRKGTIDGLQSLEPLTNVEVKLVTIPQWSGGFVPYARVVHAKYMVVDGANAWVGTSNWERDYFYESRNVGLIVTGGPFAARLERFFADGWGSSYAVAVDPCAKYEAPRIDK